MAINHTVLAAVLSIGIGSLLPYSPAAGKNQKSTETFVGLDAGIQVQEEEKPGLQRSYGRPQENIPADHRVAPRPQPLAQIDPRKTQAGPAAASARPSSSESSDGQTWTQMFPGARFSHAMDYDAGRSQVVVFGGDGDTSGSDTWVHYGSTWTRKNPSQSPPARGHSRLIHDAARGQSVLFGGLDSLSWEALKDTWIWDGSAWNQKSPSKSPSVRFDHSMTYDQARGKVVLFGGHACNECNAFGDTWVWDGSDWSQRNPSQSPQARHSSAMAYDAARSQVVLFGGGAFNNQSWQSFNDTWVWDGNSWTKKNPTLSPPPRYGHAMAYDAARGQVLLFGGWNSSGSFLDDTWVWDGSNWAQRYPWQTPPARSVHGLTYDAARAQVVLFGGQEPSGNLGDTWIWDGGTWTEENRVPHLRSYPALAGDAARAQVVMFGGSKWWVEGINVNLNDTWAWDGGKWIQKYPSQSPRPRYGHAMAYDAERAQIVLFGGIESSSNRLNETWVWDGTNWTQRYPLQKPPARSYHAMAYDAARGQVVLFGGMDSSSNRLNDTWVWDGTNWTQKNPSQSPPARCYHTLAYDATRTQMVLFGGGGIGSGWYGTMLNDTWVWNGSNWTQRYPLQSPSARCIHAMANYGVKGQLLLFGGYIQDVGELNDTWAWDGNNWAKANPAQSPRLQSQHAMAYDTTRAHVVLFGEEGHWIWGAGYSCPTLTVTPASLPAGIAGSSYSQTISATGGTAPYTYSITSGMIPAGLNLTAAGILSGTPAATGTYSFTVMAAGSGQCAGSQQYSLTINAAVGPPGKAVPVSPSGTINISSPAYTWNAVADSTWYYLWVGDSSSSEKIKQWFTANQAGCASGTGTCSVAPATALARGNAQWWVQTWNEAGYGPWSNGLNFTVEPGGIPGKATLLSPSGTISTAAPTYTWSAVSSATWYQLWVDDSTASPKVQAWYKAADAGCGSGAGTCAVTPAIQVASGSAQWWIQTWNESGYGPWSNGMAFVAGGTALPGKAALISPTGTTTTTKPVYTWSAVAGSTWYYLWVNDSAASGKIKQWFTASQAGCASGTGTCSANPAQALSRGSGQWWIQTWNEIGYGPWSDGMIFTVP